MLFKSIKEKLIKLFDMVFKKSDNQLLLEKSSLKDDKKNFSGIDNSQVEKFYNMLDMLNSNRETQLLIDMAKSKKYTNEENI
jgi:hypothetical protein